VKPFPHIKALASYPLPLWERVGVRAFNGKYVLMADSRK
jgi:hypothetical protein